MRGGRVGRKRRIESGGERKERKEEREKKGEVK